MNWHARYLQQAAWTRDLRHYLFERAGLGTARCALEVGCGTGAILGDLPPLPALHGLDIRPASLMEARVHAPGACLACGDALCLPYAKGAFDITFCHFLLLWVGDPLQALAEMKRVTRRGGHILALAEPDYPARVDRPAELIPLGGWQTESLRRQGANPSLGGRLAESFFQAGIEILETGAIQNVGSEAHISSEWELEWAVLESDLAGLVPGREIQRFKELDRQARERGERVLHVPTYFAWGQA
ncbi:MAG: class I SAM-dependent methyltransferase [Chloroflexota bacterium]